MLRVFLKKIFIGIIFLMGLSIISVFVLLRIYSDKPKELLTKISTEADISLNNIHHVATRQGEKEWILDAESAEFNKKENITKVYKISVIFFLDNGEKLHLTGSQGLLKISSNDLEIKGDVKLIYGQYNIKTECIFYSGENKTIFTKNPIYITGRELSLSGDLMTFDINNKKIIIEKNVVGIYKEKEI